MSKFLTKSLAILGSVLLAFGSVIPVSALEINENINNSAVSEIIQSYEETLNNNLDILTQKCLRGEIERVDNSDMVQTFAENDYTCDVYNYEETLYTSEGESLIADVNLYLVKCDSNNEGNVSTFAYNGDDGTDPKGLATLSTVIYYNKKYDSDGNLYYNFYQATGSASLTTGTSLSNRTVIMASIGTSMNALSVNEQSTKYPSSNSWSYNTGFSEYIHRGGYNVISVKYTATISSTRESVSPYSYTFQHTI